MENQPEQEQVTPEQQKQLNKLALFFILKSLWNGASGAVLIILMNFVMFFGISVMLDGNQAIMMVLSIAIAFFGFRRITKACDRDLLDLMEKAEKILKK